MTLDPASKRPLLMMAGSTGLAPMKAMIGQIARDGGRTTHLYFGARSQREIYDRQRPCRAGRMAPMVDGHHRDLRRHPVDGPARTGR